MKFTVKKQNLSKALSILNKAINPRTSLPLLSNILIKTEKGRLKMMSSDLMTTISVWIGAKIDEQGEFTVPAKILTDFVAQLKDDTIDFSLEGSTLKSITTKAKSSFSGMPASEFPTIEADENAKSITVKSKLFLDALSKVSFSVAIDESRPILTGIYVRINEGRLVLASTDGFRMAEYRLDVEETDVKEFACVVPGKYLFEIAKSFCSEAEDIRISLNEKRNVILISVEDMQAQIRLLEGNYPDYEAIIPDEFTTDIVLRSEELSNGLKLASVFAREGGNMIKLSVADSNLEIVSQPTELGSNVTDVVSEISGEDIQIAFNAKYLIDFTNNIADDEVTIKLLESLKPGMFRLSNNKDYFYIVMPMRANW